MDPGTDLAQCRLFFRVRNPGEGTLRARHDFRNDGKLEVSSIEEGNQHGGPTGADDSVRSWVGRGRRGVADRGKPIRVRCRIRIVVGCRRTYRGDGPPEIVNVFGVVESDHVIGECQVEQREKPCTLRRRQIMREGCRLANFVPVVLNRPIPKAPRERLIRCACPSVCDSNCFNVVKCIGNWVLGPNFVVACKVLPFIALFFIVRLRNRA
jgi:hypothetical protein